MILSIPIRIDIPFVYRYRYPGINFGIVLEYAVSIPGILEKLNSIFAVSGTSHLAS